MSRIFLLGIAVLMRSLGVRVEVVDPRTLVPLDKETIADSVNKTGRVVIVTQASYTGSFASHISHEISRRNKRNPERIGL